MADVTELRSREPLAGEILGFDPGPAPENKMKAYTQAHAKIGLDRSTMNPLSIFRVGDVINISGLTPPEHNGVYKVCEVTPTATRYRQLTTLEKFWQVVKYRARQWWQRAK